MKATLDIYQAKSHEKLVIDQALPVILTNKINKKKQTRKRRVSMHAYQLLFQQLSIQHQILDPQLQFTKSGKPMLMDSTIQFNISHSQNDILIAISNHIVGIDIEHYRPFVSVSAAFSFFTLKEQNQIRIHSNPEKKLIEFWSKKEALIKAIGSEMFDIAAHLDICENQVRWEGIDYYLHPLKTNLNAAAWLACTLSNYERCTPRYCKIST